MTEALRNPNVRSLNVLMERDLRASFGSMPAERCQHARTCTNAVIGLVATGPATVVGNRK
jgi:hypothetical protein